MTNADRALGMNVSISRRDVVKGIGLAALSTGVPDPAWAAPELNRRWGGNPDSVFTIAHAMRDGVFESALASAPDSGGSCDVVIVGGGLSGLTAAYLLNRESGGRLKILVIDNHSEPGGAARADEFTVRGRTLRAAQGSVVFQMPPPALAPEPDALALIEKIMPDLDRYRVPRLEQGFSVVSTGPSGTSPKLHKNLMGTPLPDDVRDGYFAFLGAAAELYHSPDWRKALAAADTMTFRKYIRDEAVYSWMKPELASFFCMPDQVSAAAVLRQYGGGPPIVHHLPGGNAAFASALISLPGKSVQMLREATVVSLANRGNAVEVIHADRRQKLRRTRARAAIMAGGAFAARHILRDPPTERVEALQRFIHAPIVWINVVLGNARAVDAADPGFLTLLHGLRATLMVTYGKATDAGWRSDRDPARPVVLGLSLPFFNEGLPAAAQAAAARQQILEEPFESYERWVRQDLNVILGRHGFDAARDIVAISVCRWGHGYVYPDPGFLTDGARESAAAPLGRIAFANTDLDGFSHLPGAVGHGLRAAREVLNLI